MVQLNSTHPTQEATISNETKVKEEGEGEEEEEEEEEVEEDTVLDSSSSSTAFMQSIFAYFEEEGQPRETADRLVQGGAGRGGPVGAEGGRIRNSGRFREMNRFPRNLIRFLEKETRRPRSPRKR